MTDYIIIFLLAWILYGNSRFGTRSMNALIEWYKRQKRNRRANKDRK